MIKTIKKIPFSIITILSVLIYFYYCYFYISNKKSIPYYQALYFSTKNCKFKKYWTMITYSLVHKSHSHFLANIIFIFVNIIYLELNDKIINIFLIIIMSSITGALGFFLMNKDKAMIGSSCITFGLVNSGIAKYISSNFFKKNISNNDDNQSNFDSVNIIVNNEIEESNKLKLKYDDILFIINIVLSLSSFIITGKNIAYYAHIVSSINGLLLGLAVFKKEDAFLLVYIFFFIIYLLFIFNLFYNYLYIETCNTKNGIFNIII